MRMVPVAGATYYFDFPSIIGLYILDDRSCCLIDSGERIDHIRQVRSYLREQGYEIKAILSTHFHPDHCWGHGWLQDQQDCAIYASPFEAALLENPELSPFSLYTASPLKVLQNRYLLAPPCKVTHRVGPGPIMIDGLTLAAVNLSGHTPDHLGWLTPDGVLFAGDSLLAPGVLAAGKLNYTADVTAHIRSLEYLRTHMYTGVVAAHGGLLDDVPATVTVNREAVDRLLAAIQDLLAESALGLEDILAALIIRFDLPLNHSQYFLIRATTSAYLAYLYQERKVITRLQEGRLLYQTP